MKLIGNKILLFGLFILLALAYPIWSYSRNGIPVQTTPVKRGRVVSTITSTTSGSVEPRASATLRVEISARVGGVHDLPAALAEQVARGARAV